MLFPLLVGLMYEEYDEALAFLICIGICLVPGIIAKIGYKIPVTQEKIRLRESYLIVTVSWFLASLFGCLPYILTGVTDDFFIAYFETASGFSTTGATAFNVVETLPHCILFWRSLTQWLGGMGMIVLFMALVPKFGVMGGNISKAETPGPIQRKISSRYAGTAQKLYASYIILTLILVVLLLLGGMNLFDASSHALTTMATGGFSTHTGGLSYFGSPFIYGVIAIFALLAGSNFTLFFDIIYGRIKDALKDEEYVFYVKIIAVSSVLIAISLRLSSYDISFGSNLGAAFFQTVNTISTLGFESSNSTWPSFCIMILAILMVVGGCSSSTAGGFKCARVLVLLKVLKRGIKQMLYGSSREDIRYNGNAIQDETMRYILSFVILYLTTTCSATILICLFGKGDVMTNLLTVISCISNLGPGLDNLGLICDYNLHSRLCIIVYTTVMIAGRLELSTFLVIFSRYFRNPDRA